MERVARNSPETMTTEKKCSSCPVAKGKTWRWGIIGTGRIAHDFCLALNHMPRTAIVAVGSREEEKSKQFALDLGIQSAYGSYEQVTKDPEVDIIYVSVVHPLHKSLALMCLEQGKNVLCEKPLTVNAEEAKKCIDKAREKRVFFMEGMWSRCFPSMHKIRELLYNGAIGDVKAVHTDFGVKAGGDVARYWELDLGAGATLDLGVYAVAFASMVFGGICHQSHKPITTDIGSAGKNFIAPSFITAVADVSDAGFDTQVTIGLKYGGGGLCSLTSSTIFRTAGEAFIFGSKGSIKLHGPEWQTTTKLTLTVDGKDEEVFEYPLPRVEGDFAFSHTKGFVYQIQEVTECLDRGALECNVMPLDESLVIMRTLDAVRAQPGVGVQYPQEDQRRQEQHKEQ